MGIWGAEPLDIEPFEQDEINDFFVELGEMIAANDDAEAQALITDALTLEGDEIEGAERGRALTLTALLVGRTIDHDMAEQIEEWLAKQHADQLFLWRELAHEAADYILGEDSELAELLDAELVDGSSKQVDIDEDDWLEDEDEDDDSEDDDLLLDDLED